MGKGLTANDDFFLLLGNFTDTESMNDDDMVPGDRKISQG